MAVHLLQQRCWVAVAPRQMQAQTGVQGREEVLLFFHLCGREEVLVQAHLLLPPPPMNQHLRRQATVPQGHVAAGTGVYDAQQHVINTH